MYTCIIKIYSTSFLEEKMTVIVKVILSQLLTKLNEKERNTEKVIPNVPSKCNDHKLIMNIILDSSLNIYAKRRVDTMTDSCMWTGRNNFLKLG